MEVKGHLGSTGVKLWKPCKHDISRRETWTDLLFSMLVYLIEYKKPIVFGGGQRSFEVNRGQIVKPCKQYLKKGSLDRSHIWYVGVPCWVQKAYCFWWRSKVIWGQQGSNCGNHVNTLSQKGKLGQISYLVCRCTLLSTRSLLLLVEVKGHLGSTEVKLWKPRKHNGSRREAWTDLIFGM